MQRHKLGSGGSFINHLMSNNDTMPELDQWVTKLHYSDRTVGKVVEVSDEKTRCRIQWYNAVWNSDQPELGSDIGHQNWKFEPTESFSNLSYNAKKLRWEIVYKELVFSNAYLKTVPSNVRPAQYLPPQIKEQIYGDSPFMQNEVPPYNRIKTEKSPIKVLFGQCDYYYDWSF